MNEPWLEDLDAPEEESDYWEDNELTPEELAGWFKAAREAEAEAREAGRASAAGLCLPAEGSGLVPWPRAMSMSMSLVVVAHAIVDTLMDALPTGSYLVMSHVAPDEVYAGAPVEPAW